MEVQELHWSYTLFSTVVLLADFFIRVGLSTRVIMRKRPYGISLAWLVVILLVPFLGGFCYLLFGENRLPEKRTARARISYDAFLQWIENLQSRAPVTWQDYNPECIPLNKQANTLVGIPAMAGNDLTLITSPEKIIKMICESIENARSTCHLQFYIWEEGGRVNQVIDALIQAARRGVTCRLLLDSIGSRDFLKSRTAARMKESGIKIEESLPAGLISAFFSRVDIRNHRKIVVIDGATAYTGSQNMVDPDVFKKDAGVGNWIDIMVKVKGPVVEPLGGIFIGDWYLETDVGYFGPDSLPENMEAIRTAADLNPRPLSGESAVQLVPSGPGYFTDAIHSLLLTTIYSARKELVMTTPYFIPDESLLDALKAAAERGVDVNIIVPKHNDSRLVHFASRARYEELANAGVKLQLFNGGLLHSKTITVDGDFSLFGSVNLDMRSFWLNFEATLLIYCKNFTTELLEVQRDYLKQSEELDLETFQKRSHLQRFIENCVLLVSPLL